MSPTVFLVDDDAAVRDALSALFRAEAVEICTYESAEAFLAQCPPDATGCLVLDVRMPGLGGLGLQQTLAERGIRLPIIFLTGHGDIPMSVRALRAGAVDFLEKPADPDTLLARVRDAFAQDARQRTEEAGRETVRTRCRHLTPREREILAHVAAGRTSKEIARALAISPRTVEVHRSHLMVKLDAHTLADLVASAALCGCITPLRR